MTSERFAEWVGVTRMTVYRWEHGRSPVPADIIDRMLSATPDWILTVRLCACPWIEYPPADDDERAEMAEMEQKFSWKKSWHRAA